MRTCQPRTGPAPADRTRFERFSRNTIGSKFAVHSPALVCSDAFAYDNGTHTQTENGQSVEGKYLVVLFWIVQHRLTAGDDSLARFPLIPVNRRLSSDIAIANAGGTHPSPTRLQRAGALHLPQGTKIYQPTGQSVEAL